MLPGADVSALQLACQSWRVADHEGDRAEQARDAVRIAARLGADPDKVAELAYLDRESAHELFASVRDEPAMLVEEMFIRWTAGDIDGSFGAVSDDVVITSPHHPPINGIDELRIKTAADAEAPTDYTMTLENVTAHGTDVLLRATAVVRDGPFKGNHDAAWLYRTEHGRITSITGFSSPAEAAAAAGFDFDATADRRVEPARNWWFANGALRPRPAF